MIEKTPLLRDDEIVPVPPEARSSSIVWDEKGLRPGVAAVEATIQLSLLDDIPEPANSVSAN